LDRALESIENLKVRITELHSGENRPFVLEGQHVNNGLQYSMIAKGEPQVPSIISVLVGEIIHQMRSSLDHLVTALVVNNNGLPSTSHQFPICTTADLFSKFCQRGALKGISSTAFALIKNVQPYTSDTPDDTILHVVQKMNNLDKHQLLIIVSAAAYVDSPLTFGTDEKIARLTGRLGKSPIITGFESPLGLQPITPEGTLLFGVKFQEPAPEFTAEGPLVSTVVFPECGRASNIEVVDTLKKLLQGVGHTVNQFSSEF